MRQLTKCNQIKRIVILFNLLVYVGQCYSQTTYSQPTKTYKNGALVETYSNDKLQISVSAIVEKVFYNAKEIFYNIIVIPKTDNVTLIVDDIKAFSKNKELSIYDYQSYKTKLNRNIFLWGPSANTIKTITTTTEAQTTGTSNQSSNISGSVATYSNNSNLGSTASVSGNSDSNTSYNETTNVKSSTKIIEPNPVYYETNQNAEKFAEGYLRSNTANIGDIINGFIVTKYSKTKNVELIIPLFGDTYRFSFDF